MGNSDITTHKFSAVLNKKVEIGLAMNALAHMTAALVSLASSEQKEQMGFVDYADKDNGSHILSKDSFVILRADNSNQLRTARNAAKEAGLLTTDFTNTTFLGTYLEQIEQTKNTAETELEYFGICLFGEIERVNAITKKFQLWK